VLRFMRTRGHGPRTERLMVTLGAIGEWGAVWAATGVVAASLDPERRGRWLTAAAVAPVAVGANFAVKAVANRPRPRLAGLPPLARAPTSLSFPSAHATSSFAAATALGRIEPRARLPLYSLAVLIGLTRPYLGMHYPSDVVAGAALGLALGRAVPGLDGDPPDGPEERMVSRFGDMAVAAAQDGHSAVRAGPG
jgi:decaprenylphosphoryl-5-phosphoribose phosphatase